MKRAYPAFIVEHQKTFLVSVPDMRIFTEGFDFVNAIEMARDAIGLKGISLEDEEIEIPQSSSVEEATRKVKMDADIFDYSVGTVTFIDVDFAEYRRKNDNRSVRRNVTIPNWLNKEVEKAGINVSRTLKEALIEKLGISK